MNYFNQLLYYINKIPKFTKQILVGTLAFGLATMMFLGMSDYSSNMRMIKAGYGQLTMSYSKTKIERVHAMVKKIALGEIKVNAGVPGVPGVPQPVFELGKELAAIFIGISNKLYTEVLLNFLVAQVINQLFSAINSLFSSILNTLDQIISTVQKLATAVSGTRIAIGFKVFGSLHGKEGQGNSNFKGAKDLAIELVTGKNSLEAVTDRSWLADNYEIINLVQDTISWMDFMNIQRYSQYDIIGDALATDGGLSQIFNAASAITPELGVIGRSFLIDNLEEAKLQIDDLVSAKKCAQPNNAFGKIPIVGLLSPYRPCSISTRGNAYSVLSERYSRIETATKEQIAFFNFGQTQDCKNQLFYDVDPSFDVAYDVSKPGDLGVNIAKAANLITLNGTTPEQCTYINNYRFQQGLNAQAITANISPDFGVAIDQFVNNLGKEMDRFFTNIFEGMKARFDRMLNIINNINLGNGFLLYTTLFKIAYTIRKDIRDTMIQKSKDYNVPLEQITDYSGISLDPESTVM